MTFWDLLIVAFAAFAITYLLCYTDGPCNVFRKIRDAVSKLPTLLIDLYGCFWCLGFWVCMFTLMCWMLFPSVHVVIYVFCMLGIIGFLHEEIAG